MIFSAVAPEFVVSHYMAGAALFDHNVSATDAEALRLVSRLWY